MNSNRFVLLVGPFLTDDIVHERGIPFRNAAASNRMARLTQAMGQADLKISILSPASAMRLRRTRWGSYPSRAVRSDSVRILYAPCCGVPFLAAALEPWCMARALYRCAKRRPPAAVVLYNYYPSTLFAGLLAKWAWRSRMIIDVEDVCAVRWQDWIGRGDPRPLQQAVGSLLLRLGLYACDHVIVPSRRFLARMRCRKPATIVNGCMPSPERRRLEPAAIVIRVLLSGTLDEEQGIGLVLEAFAVLASRDLKPRCFEVHVCGHAPQPAWLAKQVESAAQRGCRITQHGHLSTDDYRALLQDSDVCIAMQLPSGRHADAKIPSKVYEYLGHGKVVIASTVGDLADIPSDVLINCEADVDKLAGKLEDIASTWGLYSLQGARAAAYADEHFSLPVVGCRLRDLVLGEVI